MRYRYLDDFRRGISVFAIFSYGIAVLGTPQCPPQAGRDILPSSFDGVFSKLICFFLGCGASFDFGVKSRLLDSAVKSRLLDSAVPDRAKKT